MAVTRMGVFAARVPDSQTQSSSQTFTAGHEMHSAMLLNILLSCLSMDLERLPALGRAGKDDCQNCLGRHIFYQWCPLELHGRDFVVL